MSQQFGSAVIGLAFALGGAVATPVSAQEQQPVVVELFTSQGCSSCPPADEFAATLLMDPDIILLAMHVDYWDYIGWKDSFASPAFTNRQKAYARAVGSRTIYTPQLIIDGEGRIEGVDPARTRAEIMRAAAEQSPVTLKITREGEELLIEAEASAPLSGDVVVHLVRYRPSETVKIERGENRGRTITYHNIVTKWDPVGEWSGKEPLSLRVPVPGTGPSVVLIQERGPAKILAAAQTD